jgi:lysophospholipase L1-like esterase
VISVVCLLLASTTAYANRPPGGGGGGGKTPSVAYTALGDSIAVGKGATSNYGYVYHFRDYLASVHGSVDLKNQAKLGIKSGDLLTQLRLDRATRTAVKKAKVITISIGGNNLLGCASDNYNGISDSCAASGVSAFSSDWPKILQEIRNRIGSTGQIYVMNIYNPYTGDDSNYVKANDYVQQINDVISRSDYVATYSYTVVDVYSHFSGTLDGSWKVCQWTHFCASSRDPHPNDEGHRQISSLHESIYVQ